MRLQQGSAAAPGRRKSKVENKMSQYDTRVLVDQRDCLPPLMLGKCCSLASELRRMNRSILPCPCLQYRALPCSYYQLTT